MAQGMLDCIDTVYNFKFLIFITVVDIYLFIFCIIDCYNFNIDFAFSLTRMV